MEKNYFSYLLIALLVLLLGIPFVDDLGVGSARIVRAAIFSLVLLIGVWSLKGGGNSFRIGMAFAVAGVAFNVAAAQTGWVAVQYGSLLAMIGFLLVAITFTMRRIAIGTEISINRIVGAVCVYLLLGVIWAYSYSLLELTAPGSFKGFMAWAEGHWDSEWLYFSFVTMTTLGYGDIVPLSATARALAYLQAIFGQFYIAVLVAGLVSAYVSKRSDS